MLLAPVLLTSPPCRYVQSLLDAKLLLISGDSLGTDSVISLNLKYTSKRVKFKIAGTVQKETPQAVITNYFGQNISFLLYVVTFVF